MIEPTDDSDATEARISDLESELRPYLFPPLDRSDFLNFMLSINESDAKMQNIDLDWRRNNPAKVWLEHLEFLKSEKDRNSSLWNKLKNWD